MFLSSRSNRSIWPHILAPLLAGLLIAAALHNSAQAASPVYVIPDSEGYGVLECLTRKSDCGKTVADSWCEAHGHGPAKAFGSAEDVTASIGPASGPAPTSGSAIVSCAE